MPAYWIYVIGLRKWWTFYDTLMWPLMGNYAKCVNIAFASTQHVTITSKRRNLTMWPFALHLLMFWGLRQKFLAEWSKASRYPQWCWIRYFWSPAMLYQRCWCKCSVAVVYRAGQPSRIVLPDSLWQPLNSFIAFNCSWFFDQLLQSVFCFVTYLSALKITSQPLKEISELFLPKND